MSIAAPSGKNRSSTHLTKFSWWPYRRRSPTLKSCVLISHTHAKTRLIRTDFRPVPLKHLYFHRDLLSPLLNAKGQLNDHLTKVSPFVVKGNVQRKVKRDEPLATPQKW